MNQQTEILELEVTQEDIDDAIIARDHSDLYGYKVCSQCPVSQAAFRVGVTNFHESAGGKLFGKKGIRLWDGGMDCRKFQACFDDKQPVRPTKFIFTKV